MNVHLYMNADLCHTHNTGCRDPPVGTQAEGNV